MRVFSVHSPIATYLGALALVLMVSFSPPVSCSHGVISAWQAPMRMSDGHNRPRADYRALSWESERNSDEGVKPGDHQPHSPWQDSRTITAPCSGTTPNSWGVAFVLSPFLGYPTTESYPKIPAHLPPLEPPPRPALSV